jgi:TolA-binding protein
MRSTQALKMSSRRALLVLALASAWPAAALAQDEAAPSPPEAAPPAEAAAQPEPESPSARRAREEREAAEKKDAEPKDAQPQDLPAGPKITLPAGASDEARAEIEAFQRDYLRYEKEIDAYRREVSHIVKDEYQLRRQEIEEVYDQEIKGLELIERERREEALAAFEEFLRKYPNHPRYTPDVIYRLAELYFEKANDDFLLADENFQSQQDLYDLGRIPDPPQPPERNYEKSISLFQRLITDFPQYRFVDGAYYLLGYCLNAMGKEEEALRSFEDLIRVVPGSRYVPEAWVRIGEYHFDYNQIDQAIAAYANALNYPDNAFYDKALYKLAWSYYRGDRFEEAIAAFKDLVRYADKKKKETGKSGSELREEAIQYLAISLSEEDWDNDGEPDEDFGMTRVRRYLSGQEPYEQEVLVRLADILFDNTRYEQAIEIYKLALEKYPLAQDNPKYHDKMILALERLRRFDDAMAERRQIGLYYGPGTDWYKQQEAEGNQEALSYAEGLARNNLIDSATWYHEQAQKLADEAVARKDAAAERDARERFALAATAYEKYLDQYPHDREAYKWRYYLAECLFYSAQYERAAESYALVRELDAGENEFREPAAFNAVKSLEFLVADGIRRGEIPAAALPEQLAVDDPAEDGSGDPKGRGEDEQVVIEAQPIPEAVLALNTARERYVALGLKNERDPLLIGKFDFQAARIYYDFQDFPEARKRFELIIDRYEGQDVSIFAATLLLQSFLLEKDYDNMALWADRISQNPKLANSQKAKDIRQEAERLKLGALFKSADEFMDAGDFEKAAEAYIKVVNANPKNEYADDALNNAAVAYEKVKRYESAMKLYGRVVQEYPESPLAPVALFRVSYNAERFFDFDKAVSNYLLLVDNYPKSEDREKSLRRAGVILENLQEYNRAAQVYTRFADEFPNSPEAPLALYQAVKVYEKMGNAEQMTRTFGAFKARYGGNPKYNLEVMEGLDKIASRHFKDRNYKAARDAFQGILKEYVVRGIEAGSPPAEFAAKAQFYLAEMQFMEWDKIAIKGNPKAQEKALKLKIDGAQKVRPEFEKVYDYRNREWIMAAGYRAANVFQRFAQALYDADIPFEEGSEEFYVYQTRLEDLAVPLEDQAVEAYEKVLNRAREDRVVNDWTKKVLVELNKYKPADYPLFHEEKIELTPFRVTPPPPLSPAGMEPPPPPAPRERDEEPEDEAPAEAEAPEAEAPEAEEPEEPDPSEPSLPELLDDK